LAFAVDGALLFAFVVISLIASSSFDTDGSIAWTLAVVIIFAILYDPVLVATTGGTIGHHLLNLKVVADATGGHLGFGRALVRTLVKGVLGIASFIFMGVTRRHQALHDLASRSTVQFRHVERARRGDVAPERIVVEPVGVSRFQRAIVILAYLGASFVLMSVASIFVASEACVTSNICTPAEDLSLNLLVLAWVGISAVIIVGGWRGRLFGCRPRGTTAAV
jgi:uncharacterized RDD family membrane protein YckC